MRAVFADAFYFLAFLNSRDPAHAKAIAFSRVPGLRFVTTDYVLLELRDAFHKPPLRAEFLALHELLHRESVFRVVAGQRNLLQRGVQFFKKRPDKDWPLTDCISFVVMRDERIREALTGDPPFRASGLHRAAEMKQLTADNADSADQSSVYPAPIREICGQQPMRR